MALYVGDATEFGDQKHLHVNEPAGHRCSNGDDIVERKDGKVPIYFDDIHIAAMHGFTILCVDFQDKCWG